jgi:hypothetical protein
MSSGAFGPWSSGLDATERVAQFRSLASLAALMTGSGNPLVQALRQAEHDTAAAALALDLINALPALTRRRLLSTFGAVTWPRGGAHGGR